SLVSWLFPRITVAPELLVKVPVTVTVLELVVLLLKLVPLLRLVSTRPELVRLPEIVSEVTPVLLELKPSTSRRPLLLTVNVPEPGVAVWLCALRTSNSPSMLLRAFKPLLAPAVNAPPISSRDPETTSVIPLG